MPRERVVLSYYAIMEREGMDCVWVWWSREASMTSEEMACNDKTEVMDLRDF